MGVITETFRVDGVEKAEQDLKRMAAAAESAGDALTEAEKEAARSIAATNAALIAKAKATGLTIQEIKQLEAETKRLAAANKDATAATGQATGSMAAMAQQLPDVVTQLASGSNALQVFTQQGLQVAQSSQAVMAAITPLLPVLGALAAVAAEVYVAYRVLTMEQTEAAAVADVVTGATQNLVDWTEIQRQATLDLAEATGELSAAEVARARNAIEMQKQWLQSTADLRAKAAELRKEQESLTTQAVDLVGSALGVVDVFGVNRMVFDAFTTDSAELQTQLDAVNGVIATQTEEARKTAEQLDKASDAKQRATERSKSHKDALTEETKAEKERFASMEDLIRQEERLREAELALAEAERQAFEAAVTQMEAQDAKFREADRRTEEAQRAKEAAGTTGSKAAAAAQDIAAIGQAAAGGLAGIAGAANPIAGALVSVFLDLEGIVAGLIEEITALPQRLIQMPSLIGSLITASAEAIPAIFAALPKVVEQLISVFLSPEVIGALARIAIEGVLLTFGADPRLYIAIVRGIVDAVPELVRAWIQAMKALPQQLLTGGRESMREWVPRSRGDGPNITINGMVGDGQRLGAGIRGLFDRDFGRVRARS